jgi:transglutaminase-like putative cysteine protease
MRDRDARPVPLSRDDIARGVLRAWASQFSRHSGETDPRRLLVAMARFIRETMQQHANHGGTAQTPLTTLTLQSGTDIDFATLMIEAIRTLDYPVRVVAAQRPGVQVFLPGQGWVNFDPSNL